MNNTTNTNKGETNMTRLTKSKRESIAFTIIHRYQRSRKYLIDNGYNPDKLNKSFVDMVLQNMDFELSTNQFESICQEVKKQYISICTYQ